MGIALPDSPVPAVDEQLGTLITGDLAPGIEGLSVGAVNGCGPLATDTAYDRSAVLGRRGTHNRVAHLPPSAGW